MRMLARSLEEVCVAEEVIGLESRLRLVLLGSSPGVSVTDLCADMGVSRETFYKWRRRYEAEGLEGLRERSRRPAGSSLQVSAALEDEIVRVRKELVAEGSDAGARSILDELGWAATSVSTVHRVLVRRGLVIPQPEKRPRSSWRRFEWPQPNAVWQIDATEWRLAGGSKVEIIDILDDHSRLCVAFGVTEAVTMEAAWETLAEGMIELGPPARLLSDGGLAFTGRRHGVTVEFEEWVAGHRIHQMVSSPRHPQTLGKLERFHQTLKRWLAAHPAATTDELAELLERFRDRYNHERTHQGIGRVTPASRWHGTPRAEPGSAFTERKPATKAGYRKVGTNGVIGWGPYDIGVSVVLARQVVCVIQTGHEVEIFNEDKLIRRLIIDPTRRYQPTRRPPGRPPRNK